MVCQVCGTAIGDGVYFCSKCGARVASAPPAYVAYQPMPRLRSRVEQHLQTLGILWCIFGAYRLLKGLMGMAFLKAATMHGFGNHMWGMGYWNGPGWLGSLLPFVAAYTVVISALSLFVGFSLLTRRPWGRTLAIVVAILTLLKPILGTVLGIYTLWALAPELSGAEYGAIADRS
jgi:hypothetical protein